jgi:hypothetical protein
MSDLDPIGDEIYAVQDLNSDSLKDLILERMTSSKKLSNRIKGVQLFDDGECKRDSGFKYDDLRIQILFELRDAVIEHENLYKEARRRRKNKETGRLEYTYPIEEQRQRKAAHQKALQNLKSHIKDLYDDESRAMAETRATMLAIAGVELKRKALQAAMDKEGEGSDITSLIKELNNAK